MKKKIFFALALMTSANAMAWTLFGPKNYDECILQNMKGVTDKTAAELIMMSCSNKFSNDYKPSKEEQAATLRAEQAKLATELLQKKRAAKCGISITSNGDFELKELRLGNEYEESTSQYLNLIKNAQFDKGMQKISFQNNNKFGVVALRIGFIKGKVCSNDSTAYEAIVSCTGYRSGAVTPSSYGSLSCDRSPSNAGQYGYCLIGIAPQVQDLNDQLDFFETRGMCN